MPFHQLARAIRLLALHHIEGTGIHTGLWRDKVIGLLNTEVAYGPSLSRVSSHLSKVLSKVTISEFTFTNTNTNKYFCVKQFTKQSMQHFEQANSDMLVGFLFVVVAGKMELGG